MTVLRNARDHYYYHYYKQILEASKKWGKSQTKNQVISREEKTRNRKELSWKNQASHVLISFYGPGAFRIYCLT